MKKSIDALTVNALNACKWKKSLFVSLVLLVPIINFFVFWLYPNLEGILLAFKNMEGGKEYYTLGNFRSCFDEIFSGNGDMGSSFINTMKYFLFDIIIFPLGILWGYIFYRKIKGYNFFRLMFYIPTILSSVVVAGMFKYLLNSDGPIGVLWTRINNGEVVNFFFDERYAFGTTLFYYYWIGFSGNLLLLSGAFAKIPLEILESANLDGCGWWKELWRICLPMIWPTVSTLIITMFSGFFFGGAPILLLTNGAGNTSTISYWMFVQIKLRGAEYMPSAFGLILTIFTLPIVLSVRKIVNSLYKEVEM